MKHTLKRCRLLVLYVLVVAAIGYSGWQLRSASADEEMIIEAGTCCTTSAGCGGTQICYLPDKRAACCDNTTPACNGANYCQAQ